MIAASVPTGALSQESPQPDQPELVSPKLVSFSEATYPQAALEAKVEGEVVLVLTIDADGKVIEAVVESGLGHGLDQAAKTAALAFVFEPARRQGKPITSRIRYRYGFELPQEATGGLRGSVLLSEGEAPAVGAKIVLVAEDGTETVVRTDENGEFASQDLPVGHYQVRASAPGLGSANLRTDVSADETTEISLRLVRPDEEEPIEVTVRGESAGERLQKSARAVEIVDTEEASKQAADMGEVLAREEGVGVRRTGGLGSGTRFSLNGLQDNQIRFFLDGIPLEYAGFPFGLANVPVNLIDRVDIYSGVVPIRLGADALGGAVELISPQAPEESGVRASYQVGSFDTHRLTLSGQAVDEETGIYARTNGFLDYAQNDYPVDLEVGDPFGKSWDVTVRRFHDTYRAMGAGIDAGITDQSWADRLSSRLFFSDFARDLQHNVIMSVPYGEATYGETVAGGTLRYEHTPFDTVAVDLIGGYNYSRGWVEDTGTCHYDWFGRCLREKKTGGELGERPSDRAIWEHAAFARLNGSWRAAANHAFRLTVAPTFVTRTGEERAQFNHDARDPLSAQRDLFDLVTGVEYELDVVDDRFQNIAFFKDYVQVAATEEPLKTGGLADRDRTTHRLGFGDSLRFRINDWLYTKASYEWATRLPTPEEIFGDAVLILPNLGLKPESSHNANLEVTADDVQTAVGAWRGQLTGFVREADQLIVLLGNKEAFTYNNVYSARALGFEAAAGWTSPGDVAALDANLTYVDLRNVSDQGTFGDFEGDRIPNRPWLYANGSARVQGEDVITKSDHLSLTWQTRYVHDFFRGWESLGKSEFKQLIPAQWQHSLSLTYLVTGTDRALSTTVEVQNLTDATLYDFFGVQRPGRAFYLKTTLEL